MDLKILITGCGRSGTGYAAETLQALGLDVGHEHERKNGTSDWRALTWDKDRLQQYDLILHQVRHPLKVISSWHTVAPSAWEEVYKVLPDLRDTRFAKNYMLRTMVFWFCWNAQCGDLALDPKTSESRTYKVEEFTTALATYLPLEISDNLAWDKVNAVFPEYNTRKSSRDHLGDLSWRDLEVVDLGWSVSIRRLAESYGYKW